MYHRSRTTGGPYQGGQNYIDEQNDHLEDELRGKVSALKSLTIDIGAEVREHNRLLKGIDDDFDNTTGLLGSSINKIQKLFKASSRYHLLYLFFFCIFVFIVLWLVI